MFFLNYMSPLFVFCVDEVSAVSASGEICPPDERLVHFSKTTLLRYSVYSRLNYHILLKET